MKAKPRWMKTVLTATTREIPTLPYARQSRKTARSRNVRRA
ncbi:hypothetical protein [Kangsaoukella pontilimi]|nr:hypothetical protein [Kangsaoukella pontilimi]